MPPTKRQILDALIPLFAYDNAEAEGGRLQAYFVETDAWRRLIRGDATAVKGLKGSGKSALYSLLCLRAEHLLNEQRIVVVRADEPRGNSIFAAVLSDANETPMSALTAKPRPANENDFGRLWQLYFLTLLGDQLSRLPGINLRPNSPARRVVKGLEDHGLLLKKAEFALRQALERVLHILNLGVAFNTPTGAIVVELRLPEKEPNGQSLQQQVNALLQLLSSAENALAEAGLMIWLVLDRLDEMFSLLNEEVESSVLRALLQTLRDLRRYDHIKLKLFVRDDLLQRVTQAKDRVTGVDTLRPDIHLEWPREQLLDLMMRRLLSNADLRVLCGVDGTDRAADDHDPTLQEQVFGQLFPSTIDEVPTLDWMCGQLEDGTGRVAPRDFLRLIYYAIEMQLARRLDVHGQQLFEDMVLREAARNASEDHYQQAFKPEYPRLREFTDALRGHRQGLTFGRLFQIWSSVWPAIHEADATDLAKKLTDVAFLRHAPQDIYYRIAPLYHAALEIRPGDEV